MIRYFARATCAIVVLTTVALGFIPRTAPATDKTEQPAHPGAIIGGALDSLNSPDDDYGMYVRYGAAQDTIYFTSSRLETGWPDRGERNAEIYFSTRPATMRTAHQVPINEGWSAPQPVSWADTEMNYENRGTPVFSGDTMIFTAVQLIKNDSGVVVGHNYNLQLWESVRCGGVFSKPILLGAANDPDAWNSQPTLTPDGHTLFFISTRKGGKGKQELWYSTRTGSGAWSSAALVNTLNVPGTIASPHCGCDGKFYFASDWDFVRKQPSKRGKEIYCADLRMSSTGPVFTNIRNFDDTARRADVPQGFIFPRGFLVNSDSDDWYPFIAPDSGAMFFASNRLGGSGLLDIYAYEYPAPHIFLRVNVEEQVVDANGKMQAPIPTAAENIELNANVERAQFSSDSACRLEPNTTYHIMLPRLQRQPCEFETVTWDDSIVTTGTRRWSDTTYVRNAVITRRKLTIAHVFQSEEKIPYFITGYWYPNTSENFTEYLHRKVRHEFDSTGFINDSDEDYRNIAIVIGSIFEDSIYAPLTSILNRLQERCSDTDLCLHITIFGYTDSVPLPHVQSQWRYPDESVIVGVDENGDSVVIPRGWDMHKWRSASPAWQLIDKGEHGNILLSKLRARFTYRTIDEAMRNSAQGAFWETLKREGRIIPHFEGCGIKGSFRRREDPHSRRTEIYFDVIARSSPPPHHACNCAPDPLGTASR